MFEYLYLTFFLSLHPSEDYAIIGYGYDGLKIFDIRNAPKISLHKSYNKNDFPGMKIN